MSPRSHLLSRRWTMFLLALVVVAVAAVSGVAWYRMAKQWAQTCPIPEGGNVEAQSNREVSQTGGLDEAAAGGSTP